MAPASSEYMLDFLQKPKSDKEHFWALLIEPEWISSAIWNINDEGKVETVSVAPPTRWDDNLLESIDTSLSACTQNLPEDFPDPTKTVFGLPNSWIEGGNITAEKLSTLKDICEKLSLTPAGFVVLSEAVSHYIKSEDSGATNYITVGVSEQNLEISIFNLGTLSGVANVLRSVSIDDDLTEGLVRLGGNLSSFPARIILFNQKEQELEDLKETLNNADWNKIGGSKFIHTPRVEIFDPNKKIIAVALAGGSELGASGYTSPSVNNLSQPDNPIVHDVEMPEEHEAELVSNVEEPKGLTAEDLGFVQEVQPERVALPKIDLPKFAKPNFTLPKFKFSPNLKLDSRPLVIIGTSLITLMVAGFLFWWFYPKATINIYVSAKQIEESIEVSSTDIEVEKHELDLSMEKSIQTTGTKTVGDKAKGKVKVQNGTAFPINLPAGSVLVSSTDLKFVTLSSASVSGALSPSNPGSAEIEVEAGSIGSEYNLSKDEIFKVTNYPKAEVDASSIDSFSGGSSRQISAVSDSDRKKLKTEIYDALIAEAKQKFEQKIKADHLLIESSINVVSEDEQFSNKVGDEATNLKLKLSLSLSASSASKEDLTNKAKEVLADKTPSDFILKDDQIKFDIKLDGDTFNIKVLANLIPNVDNLDISKKIAGKLPNLAEDYLSIIPGFVKAEFKIKPLFPGKMGTLPHVSKNMTVNYLVEE